MATIPTDRGYVVITDRGDGDSQVDVFATMSPGGPRDRFASHSNCPRITITAQAQFEQRGRARYSLQPLAVFYSEADGRLYVTDVSGLVDAS